MATVSEIIFRMVVDASGMRRGTEEADRDLENVENRALTFGQALSKLGDNVTKAGVNMSAKLTVPIVGLGTAMITAGASFDKEMSKVQAISGATSEQFDQLREMAKKLGNETSFSAKSAAEGMQFLALAGWDTSEILAGMPGLLDLAAAGNLDLAKAADITSDTMAAFEMEAGKAGHAADVFAFAQANANTNVEQLGEGMTYIAPIANSFGWSLEGATAGMMVLADAGLKGSMAGASFATSLSRLAKPTKEMREVMAETGMAFFDAEGKMKPLPDLIAELEQGTAGMNDQQKAATISTLFGAEAFKHWSILLNEGSGSLRGLTTDLENSDGTAKRMADTMLNNLAGSFTLLKSNLEALAISFSDVFKGAVDSAINVIAKFTQWMTNVSPETKKVIVIIAGLVAAIGPLLIIFGSIATALGSVFTLFGTVSGAIAVITTGAAAATPAIGALAAIFTVLTGPVGIAALAIAGITIAGVALVNHLRKDAIPEVDRFGSEVSKGTKKALGAYFELSDGASLKLKELSYNQTTITEESKNDLLAIYGQMNTQIIAKMDERAAKQMDSTKKFFTESNALTEKEEADILAKMQSNHERQKKSQQDKENGIKAILEKAASEKRALTQQEQISINTIQDSMNENAVKMLSKNEVESKIIMQRMKDSAGDLSAKQAAEVVQQATKQRDGAVKEAEKQYDETLANIIKMRDETGIISAEQADKLIADAKKTKDETVKSANETHQQVVSAAQKQATEHIDKINWETGEVLSKWRVFSNNTKANWDGMLSTAGTFFTNLGTSMKTKSKSAVDATANFFKGLGTGAKNTFASLVSDASAKFTSLQSKMTAPIEAAKNKISSILNSIKSFFTNLKLKIPAPTLPKLPRFTLKTGTKTILGKTITYPTGFDITWAAKGGIFDAPTLVGLGEAGREAVVPLIGRRMDPFADAVFKRMEERMNFTNGGGGNEIHNHYWNVKAEEINDVQKLISLVNGIVQTVRSR